MLHPKKKSVATPVFVTIRETPGGQREGLCSRLLLHFSCLVFQDVSGEQQPEWEGSKRDEEESNGKEGAKERKPRKTTSEEPQIQDEVRTKKEVTSVRESSVCEGVPVKERPREACCVQSTECE